MATVLPTSASQTAEAVVPSASQAVEIQPLEQRMVLYNVSWETYERLSAEIDQSAVMGEFRHWLRENLVKAS